MVGNPNIDGGSVEDIRVIVADDHDIVRIGIQKLLNAAPEIQVVGEAKNGQEAIRLANEVEADVLVLDMEMPGLSGLEVARALEETNNPTRILILSAHDDQEYVSEVLKNGACGYLLKDEAINQLIDAIHRTAEGEKGWVSNGIVSRHNDPKL